MEEILALLPMITNMVGGIAGKSESDKLAEKDRNLKMTMPPEMQQAEGIAKNLSYMGLPGKDTYEEQIKQLVPTTVNQASKVAQSPSQLVDLMSRSLTESDKALSDLAVKDAEAHIGNQQNYQNLLGQKAGMNLGIQNQNINQEMGSNLQQAQGTKDLFQSINNAIGSGINTYSTLSMLGYQKDYLGALEKSWGNNKSGTDVNSLTPKGTGSIFDILKENETNLFKPNLA